MKTIVVNNHVQSLLEQFNLNFSFEKQVMYVKHNDNFIPSDENCIIVKETGEFIRSCKETFKIVQNEEFIQGVSDALSKLKKRPESIFELSSINNTQGTLAYVDMGIKIPKKLNKLISGVYVGVLDGNTQDTSLSAGIRVDFKNGGFILYFPKETKSNKRNVREYSMRVEVTQEIIEKALLLAKGFLTELESFTLISFPDQSKFIKKVYCKNVNSPKMVKYVDAIEMELSLTKMVQDSLASAIIGYFKQIYNFGENSTDLNRYLLLSNGLTNLDKCFDAYFKVKNYFK